MIEVKVIDKMPNEVIEIVRELRENGYVQGVDFDFEYRPPKYDDTGIELVYNRSTTFMFHTEKLSSWFSLRYL